MKAVEYLLPHRVPFLMVDSVVNYVEGDVPVLNAEFSIRASEFVFTSTEPPFYWPSVYVIEGLGQCCNLLRHVWTYERSGASNALSSENVSAVLVNTEGPNSDHTLEQLLDIFRDRTINTAPRISMLASVDVEIVSQVQVGELLRYSVEQTRVFDGLSRFAVQASVEGQIVVHGTIVGGQLERTL